MPKKAWVLQMDLTGFKIEQNGTKEDGRRYLFASNNETGVVVSVTLEQAPGAATLDDCWNVFRRRVKDFAPTDVKESTLGEMAISEYILADINGVKLRQKNVFACLPKEDVYIDIHLSKVEYTPKDQPLFASLLQTVRIDERTTAGSPPPGSLELMAEGSRYFLDNKIDKAIGPYRQALDLEKKERKLEKKFWYVLVDNLGMAYGITGDLKSAEETFRYGISVDADYPLFYYNLACVYGEKNDMDNAIAYLKLAFARKQNTLPGEVMPDPSKDDSFQRFVNNEKFRQALKSF